MAIHNKLICPVCGREDSVLYDDCFDFECEGDYVIRNYVGHCHNCNTELLWDEIYNFSHYENIRREDSQSFTL